MVLHRPKSTYEDLAHKTVYITGGASGIGAAMVKAFGLQGARVGFFDFDEQASASLVTKLQNGAQNIHFEIVDLRDIGALRTAFARMRERIGSADVLINNAARDDRHDWQDVTPDYWDERMNTNLRHMFFAIQAVAPEMIAKGAGSIINMGSISWYRKMSKMPAYTASKAAVQALTRTMAREFGPHRIRVNTIVPGWVATERQKELWMNPDSLAAFLDHQCLPDVIEPEDIAEMALFLGSDVSHMCTAADFMVEAGVA